MLDCQPEAFAAGRTFVVLTKYSYGAVPSLASAMIIPNTLQFSLLNTEAVTDNSTDDSFISKTDEAILQPSLGPPLSVKTI
ncbi:hypothetical protein D3C80_1570170 [compost metagenome]